MDKKVLILVIVCVLEAFVIGLLLSRKEETPVNPPDVPIIEIVRDSLIRDSIYIEIEKIQTQIVYIKEEYKQDSTDIMSASDSMLFSKFSRYIEDYNKWFH